MLYRFLLSKKGFTFVEIMLVVIVMGILVAVGVPMFAGGINAQRKKDCNNQKIMLKGTVQQAMFGMIDNGRRQNELNTAKASESHKALISGTGTKYDDKTTGLRISSVKEQCVTIGDIRGGYRSGGDTSDYTEGCEKEGAYLKKQRLQDTPIYAYFSNQEVPVCPFVDDGETSTYYIVWDNELNDVVIVCSCEKCNEID